MGIAVDGLASGLDTTNIISKLIELERRPIDLMVKKQESHAAKLDAWREVESRLSSLLDISNRMDTASEFSAKGATFINQDPNSTQTVLQASATSLASSATYTLQVNNIAKAEKEVTQGFGDKNNVIAAAGTLSVRVGSTTTNINIDSSNNTLDGIKNAINNSGAAVTASIINDGSAAPYKLILTGNDTGAANSISVNESLGLVFGGPSGNPLFSFSKTQAAEDAQFNIDGIAITKSSNIVTDVIEGVTLDLKNTGAGTLEVGADREAVKNNIVEFVKDFNEVTAYIDEQFIYDASTGESGTLLGNGSLRTIQSKLNGVFSGTVPGLSGTYTSLSQVGIRTNDQGEAVINDGELSNALRNDFQGVVNLFIGAGTTSHSNVTFLAKSKDTQAGTYEVRVSGGQVQYRQQGTSNYINMTGSGKFYSADTGSGQGLLIRVENLFDGSYGTITVSKGVADNMATEVNNLVDKTLKGLIFTEEEESEQNITDLQEQIDRLNFRINKKEETLRAQFANLEVIMSQLQEQQQFLNSQLGGLGALRRSV